MTNKIIGAEWVTYHSFKDNESDKNITKKRPSEVAGDYLMIIVATKDGSVYASITGDYGKDIKFEELLQSMIDENKDSFVYNSNKKDEMYMFKMNVNWSDEKKKAALKSLLNMVPTKGSIAEQEKTLSKYEEYTKDLPTF